MLSLIIILKIGIKIDSFELAGLKIEELYIKLNKKIIFRANEISFINLNNNSQIDSSSEEFYNLSKKAIWIDRFFEEISLKNITIGDTKMQVYYKDDKFFIDSKYLKVSVNFVKELAKNTELIKVNDLTLKDFNLSVNGNAT
ncbi:MAG: DUF3971 domain-containing protein, partial [Campylobacter sp.]|nr:DUF3971 domain-containing protein [Campylobacter sp.]